MGNDTGVVPYEINKISVGTDPRVGPSPRVLPFAAIAI